MTDDAAAVLDLERRRCEAIAAGDMPSLSDTLAEDYLHVYGRGGTADKARYMDEVTRGPRVPERGALTVRLYGSVAVITGGLVNHVNYPDRGPETIHAFVTQVAHKVEGYWRFVSFQITPIARAPLQSPAVEASGGS